MEVYHILQLLPTLLPPFPVYFPFSLIALFLIKILRSVWRIKGTYAQRRQQQAISVCVCLILHYVRRSCPPPVSAVESETDVAKHNFSVKREIEKLSACATLRCIITRAPRPKGDLLACGCKGCSA